MPPVIGLRAEEPGRGEMPLGPGRRRHGEDEPSVLVRPDPLLRDAQEDVFLMVSGLFINDGHRGVATDVGHVFRHLEGHAGVGVAAVDPVEAGDIDPIVSKEPLHAVLGPDEVSLPFDPGHAGVFVSAQILPCTVLGRGRRIGGRFRIEHRGRDDDGDAQCQADDSMQHNSCAPNGNRR
jgi:hypothetical protein